MKTYRIIFAIILAAFTFTACDEFLDVMPDNRAEINNPDKIRALLVSAYPETDYMLVTEFSSDNVDDYGDENPNHDRFIDQVFNWEDVTESDNEDTENLWGNSYIAIASANQALEAIGILGGAEGADFETLEQAAIKADLTAEMAEALLCRAYNHFILVNVFAKAYKSDTAENNPGVTYMMAPEQGLNPKYERESVAKTYEYIDRDLQLALKYVDDSYLKVPKYHFNHVAAYAFAARFYLYYEQWERSIEYADMCLGSAPSTVLRDWKAQASMTQDFEVLTNHFIDASLSSNIMLLTAYSKMGLCFTGPYSVYSRYAHGSYLANNETGIALATLLGTNNNGFYQVPMKIYSATNHDKTTFWKLPYLFEYTDPVAGIGYYRTVYPAFTTDQVLLERAEAKIILKQYDSAVEDMNLWLSNISKTKWNLTAEQINEKMKNVAYSKWNASTVKKPVTAAFIDGDIQENLIQFALLLKRVDSYSQGLRWFDIKRYGIVVERRVMGSDGKPLELKGSLAADDERTAIQIPKKVVDAGYEANKRD